MSNTTTTNKVIVFESKTNSFLPYNSVQEFAKVTSKNVGTIRVCCNENKKFLQGTSVSPKYLDGTIVFYRNDLEQNLDGFRSSFESLEAECKACLCRFASSKELSGHIQKSHNISSEEYTIKYLLQGIRPICSFDGCTKETRYVSFSYKPYCKSHGVEAMKEGGKRGGKAKETWNKGKNKYEDARILKLSVDMTGDKNHFYGKNHTGSALQKISKVKKLSKEEIEARLRSRGDDFLFPSFDYNDYTSRQYQKIECKCVKCNLVSRKTLQALERGSLCSRCYPFTVSKGELEMANFVEKCLEGTDYDILRNPRDVIPPYEIDVFIPGLNLGFEYHGIYWHMDRGSPSFDKELHMKKYELCKEKGVTLVQFFSCDWEERKDIVKSMIVSRLGLSSSKLGARSLCVDTNVSPQEAKSFFGSNHLGGHTKATKYIGLRDKKTGELIQLLSLRKSFHNKYKDYIEVARFATRKNTQVAGGFSKLMKEVIAWATSSGSCGVLSYADLMHGTGGVYSKYGFQHIGDSGLNYWYTDGQRLYNRFAFRASDNKSEKQIAHENSVHKIYGCGNAIYTLDIA